MSALSRIRREHLARGLGQAMAQRNRRFGVAPEGVRWVVKDKLAPEGVPVVAVGTDGQPLVELADAVQLAHLLEGLALLRTSPHECDGCSQCSLTTEAWEDGRQICSGCRTAATLSRPEVRAAFWKASTQQ